MRILPTIHAPSDLKKIPNGELPELCQEIRDEILEVTSRNGGHLAPNLGVVELTVALHKVFSMPRDKIVWDVGHQSYVHKLLTGRLEQFPTLRQYGGLCGFPKRSESPYDCFGTGHSSTSISAALGIACARDLAGEDYNVIAVIGDGALTGGEAMEGLNNAGDLHKKLIVVLNDNEMSISKNVGALSSYLTELRTDPKYSRVKSDVETFLKGLPSIGTSVARTVERLKNSFKYFFVPGMLFEDFGFKYLGPVDGHDLPALIETFEKAKTLNEPVFIHVLTTKGKGYRPAEQRPNAFHGTGPFDIPTGRKLTRPDAPPSYTKVFSDALVDLAEKDRKVVAITAAMPEGTGLDVFGKFYPDRFFDVGIAEQHAVTMGAGLAANGYHPVVALYSTFAQRAFDQLLHDVCMQELPFTLCLDRAGLVGDDGMTHHGVYDLSYLRLMPKLVMMVPRDENELRHMLKTSLEYPGPSSLRYPRGSGLGVPLDKEIHALPIGKSERLQRGTDVDLWAVGTMVDTARKAARLLERQGISAGVVDARFVKPLDEEALVAAGQKVKCIVTLEENALIGGFGEGVLEALNRHGALRHCRVLNLGIPDRFVLHGKRERLLEDLKLDPEGVAETVKKELDQ
ncbi:1-deoxy-D-xylulose-5-phosphate synthase [Acidaminococcus timonensis]|uniref:1-deoxy-D-xylulose-5-phosphate synthase n=1 Tax=Acidaminococcus timonensis TaxID=1871002 RepID=UPI0008DA50BC|nr:1-deoxy-D-xylulose-5-phosphate synthase [Acidaminococcus timonensis]